MEDTCVMVQNKTETDVAVLQVQVQNVEEKVSELKEDVKDLADTIDKNNEVTKQTLKDMRDANLSAHSSLSNKVSALEKWRWMMMGAGVVIGSIGFEAVGKLLK